MGFAELRKAYRVGSLEESELTDDPTELLTAWLRRAVEAGEAEPNAMALATVGADGRPSVRFVLLKDLTQAGVTFFTNYGSRKAHELDTSHTAAVALWWPHLERQVRVEGRVERLERAASEEYFKSRPRGSQLGAWTSPQSQPLASRAELEALAAEVRARFADGEVPCPPGWGGYLLRPERVEFWQGRDDRLHDRFLYSLEGGTWSRSRLAP